MIKYALRCERDHEFESWFKNSAAYDSQRKRGLIACPACGSAKVEKAIMAPRLGRSESAGGEPLPAAAAAPPTPSLPVPMPFAPPGKGTVAIMSPQERELRKKLKELREHIVKNADYVGQRFPEQARKIHYGETEHRSIYGEASPEEAKELHEEGIAFHPLPILPDEFN
ncbi:MAG TPA: DUF1178 family protein [Xanthobacteraceae bacterium]|jgi:hypothetical protein|nr:DUF1178 family protein [Xanthobacteraceae bacterium]